MKTNKEQKGEHTILIGGVKYVPEVKSEDTSPDWEQEFDDFWQEKEQIIHGVSVTADDLKKFIASELKKARKAEYKRLEKEKYCFVGRDKCGS